MSSKSIFFYVQLCDTDVESVDQFEKQFGFYSLCLKYDISCHL